MKYFLILATILLIGCSNKDTEASQQYDYETDDMVVFLGKEYKKIKINGMVWMDRNLGADKACESIKGEKECWGDLYQWGRVNDGHETRYSSVTFDKLKNCAERDDKFVTLRLEKNQKGFKTRKWYDDCDKKLWQEDGLGDTEVCPADWHVATVHDYERLHIDNSADAYAKIKLSFSGSRLPYDGGGATGGRIANEGTLGYYWTSTQDKRLKVPFVMVYSYVLSPVSFRKSTNDLLTSGYSIRCVKD